MLDVTEDAKAIMKGVRDINSKKICSLTLLYLTDIFKGCDLKKIRESGLACYIHSIRIELALC